MLGTQKNLQIKDNFLKKLMSRFNDFKVFLN
jgi:hypothetical protein